MLLARLYLNAESWIGKNMYTECMALCTEIMNSNKYALENDYSAPFYARMKAPKRLYLLIRQMR